MTDDDRAAPIRDIAETLGDISVAVAKLATAYETLLADREAPSRCLLENCRGRAGRDGLCERHHPGAVQ